MDSSMLLPAAVVTSGEGVPGMCSRHGRRAAGKHRIRFASRAPWWLAPLGVVALPVAVVIGLARQHTLVAPGWPLCDRCLGRRRGMAVAAVVCLALAAGFLAAALLVSSPPVALALVGAGGAAALAAPVAGALGSWATIVGASVTPDGRALRLFRPSLWFVLALREETQRALAA